PLLDSEVLVGLFGGSDALVAERRLELVHPAPGLEEQARVRMAAEVESHAGLLDASRLQNAVEQLARRTMLERAAVGARQDQPARAIPMTVPPRWQHNRRPVLLALESPEPSPHAVQLTRNAHRPLAPVDRAPVEREQLLLPEPRRQHQFQNARRRRLAARPRSVHLVGRPAQPLDLAVRPRARFALRDVRQPNLLRRVRFAASPLEEAGQDRPLGRERTGPVALE